MFFFNAIIYFAFIGSGSSAILQAPAKGKFAWLCIFYIYLLIFFFLFYVVGAGSVVQQRQGRQSQVSYARQAESIPLSEPKRKLLAKADLGAAMVKQQEFKNRQIVQENDVSLARMATAQTNLLNWNRDSKFFFLFRLTI